MSLLCLPIARRSVQVLSRTAHPAPGSQIRYHTREALAKGKPGQGAPSNPQRLTPAEAVQYCQRLTRRQDYDGYLASLFFPAGVVRSAVWAIRAFNIEVASIRDTVSNESIGQMKILFWKQLLKDITAGKPSPDQPIAMLLGQAISQLRLNPHWLSKLVTAREKNLTQSVYYTMDEVEAYAESTASALLYLQLECLGIKDVQADHVASHLGKAVGITTLLRATPANAAKRWVYLPQDSLARHKVSQEDLFRQGRTPGLDDAVFEIATRAHDHVLTAQSHLRKLDPSIPITPFLSSIPSIHYLRRLENTNFDIFNPKLRHREWTMPFTLWRAQSKRDLGV
ncbi:hypothetical protein IWQ60_000389 [Tieghemiomyces parasiticus]|uniref:15-cis-phytoene synthase n=1 Tax=Tieghemiomyces parasiticus TaxID=78921 RepID=A0A9W8ALU8_9FUNG|nr:hypothetical protein IWQ60_000389 [Tieghemiomyces parasiticus]